MRIAFTGHANIEKALGEDSPLNGEEYEFTSYIKVLAEIEQYLFDNYISKGVNPTIISGMARGVDEIVALIAIKYKLPLVISVLFSVAYHKNRPHSRGIRAQAIQYDKILQYENLIETHEIPKWYDNGTGEKYKYANFARNQNMVDIANTVYSYKADSYDSVGTMDCVQRAIRQNKFGGNVFEVFN